MEDQVKNLVDKAWKRYQETPQDRRLCKLMRPPSGLELGPSAS